MHTEVLYIHTNTQYTDETNKNLKRRSVIYIRIGTGWAVVTHACNPSTLGGRGRRISELEASLVYRVSSRTARATQRNPVLKKANPNKQTKKKCFIT